MASYWDKVLDKRVRRRRAVAAAGGLAMGAAILSACGGGGEEGGGGGAKDTSGLTPTPEDTSKSAKRGGVFKTTLTGEPNHFDGGIQGQIQLNVLNGLAYGGLVQNKPGVKEPSSNTEVVPDLAESWEFSPDKTELTFKLRQGVKWHNKPPASRRPDRLGAGPGRQDGGVQAEGADVLHPAAAGEHGDRRSRHDDAARDRKRLRPEERPERPPRPEPGPEHTLRW